MIHAVHDRLFLLAPTACFTPPKFCPSNPTATLESYGTSSSFNPLSRLAATLGPKSQARKLTRRDYGNVDLIYTCQFLSCPPVPLSLRLQSNLMIGVVRVYGQQTGIVYADVRGLLNKVIGRMNADDTPIK
jgi:Rad21/Rec8 like protein